MRPPVSIRSPYLGKETDREGSIATLHERKDRSERVPSSSHSSQWGTFSSVPPMNGTTTAGAATNRGSVESDRNITEVVLSPTQKRIDYSPTKKRSVYISPSPIERTLLTPPLLAPGVVTGNISSKPHVSLSPYKPATKSSWFMPKTTYIFGNGIHTMNSGKASSISPNRLGAYTLVWLFIAFGTMFVAGTSIMFWDSSSSSSRRLRNGAIREAIVDSPDTPTSVTPDGDKAATPFSEELLAEDANQSREKVLVKNAVHSRRSPGYTASTPTRAVMNDAHEPSFASNKQNDGVAAKQNENTLEKSIASSIDTKYKLVGEMQRKMKRKSAKSAEEEDAKTSDITSLASITDEPLQPLDVKLEEATSMIGKDSKKEHDVEEQRQRQYMNDESTLDFSHHVLNQSLDSSPSAKADDMTSKYDGAESNAASSRNVPTTTDTTDQQPQALDGKLEEMTSMVGKDSQKEYDVEEQRQRQSKNDESTLDFSHHVLNQSLNDSYSAKADDTTSKYDGVESTGSSGTSSSLFATTDTTDRWPKEIRDDVVPKFTPRTGLSSENKDMMREGRLVSWDQAKTPLKEVNAKTQAVSVPTKLSNTVLPLKDKSRLLQRSLAAAGPRRISR